MKNALMVVLGYALIFLACFCLGYSMSHAATEYKSQAVTLILYSYKQDNFMVKVLGVSQSGALKAGARECAQYLRPKFKKLDEAAILDIVDTCANPQFKTVGE